MLQIENLSSSFPHRIGISVILGNMSWCIIDLKVWFNLTAQIYGSEVVVVRPTNLTYGWEDKGMVLVPLHPFPIWHQLWRVHECDMYMSVAWPTETFNKVTKLRKAQYHPIAPSWVSSSTLEQLFTKLLAAISVSYSTRAQTDQKYTPRDFMVIYSVSSVFKIFKWFLPPMILLVAPFPVQHAG